MPKIDISDADFKRLQKLAVPFVDTPSAVISRILDDYDSMRANDESNNEKNFHQNLNDYDPRNLPPLSHARLIDAAFNDKHPDKAKWNSLVELALKMTVERYKNLKDVVKISSANLVAGMRSDKGFRFVSSHNFSFQGVSAPDAADIVIRCGQALQARGMIEFEWHDKEEAFMPGERGIVRF